MDNLIERFNDFTKNNNYTANFSFNEPMACKTTFQIGGKARVFTSPVTEEDFINLFSFIKDNNIKYFVLGGGSNIVFTDSVFEGIVISTSALNQILETRNPDNPDEALLTCGSGVSMKSLMEYCRDNNLWGMEKFSGLPGSVGGATFMNARCFDVEISNVFSSSYYYDIENNSFGTITYNEKDWAYKKSPYQNKAYIVLSTTFKTLEKEESLEDECAKYVQERVSRGHYKNPSAGSVFKNNRAFGSPSGKLIDECGLRGYGEGDAQVAPWHGNFIINTGNATQKDVRKVVDHVIETVQSIKGFKLECEIIFVD